MEWFEMDFQFFFWAPSKSYNLVGFCWKGLGKLHPASGSHFLKVIWSTVTAPKMVLFTQPGYVKIAIGKWPSRNSGFIHWIAGVPSGNLLHSY